MRRAVARKAMRDHDISQRRACRLVGVDPKTVRRDKPPDNPEVREEMKKRLPANGVGSAIAGLACCWNAKA